MGISIERVLGATEHGVRAVVRHQAQLLQLDVIGSREQIATHLTLTLNAEFSFSAVMSARVLDTDDRARHGLFAAGANTVRVVGMVHNVIDVSEGRSVIDVYVQAGPEFLALDAAEFGGALVHAGTPVELVIAGLCCHPTWP